MLSYRSGNTLLMRLVPKMITSHSIEKILLHNHMGYIMVVTIPIRYTNLKEIFFNFDSDNMHKWLYKYNQYFEIEEIVEVGKLKIVSY